MNKNSLCVWERESENEREREKDRTIQRMG